MDTVQLLTTITPAEAISRLRELGMSISIQTLYAGIQQGTFKFGDYVRMEKDVYFIYLAKFERWIADRLHEEVIPEVPKFEQEVNA